MFWPKIPGFGGTIPARNAEMALKKTPTLGGTIPARNAAAGTQKCPRFGAKTQLVTPGVLLMNNLCC